MKEKLYDLIAGTGIKILSSTFPEYYAKEPLTPTDRWIEYPFVIEKIRGLHYRILDVGCSGSMLPLLMRALGHEVYGIDIRPNYSDIRFFQRDICYNYLVREQFEVITAISTIEHIGLRGRYGADEKSSDLKAVSEIHRLLKPHGVFLMTVPFAEEYEETKWHRIYDKQKLDTLLTNFTYSMRIVQSPEADYQLALIFAMRALTSEYC